jgi:hypothetical protein
VVTIWYWWPRSPATSDSRPPGATACPATAGGGKHFQSDRYANPESYLIPPASWPASRPEVCTLTQTPQDGAARVNERQTELEALLRRFDHELPHHPSLRIEDESLVVGPLHAEDKPPSLVALEALINGRLPLVELPDLLMEVDGWTDFSRHLEHAGGAEPRAQELLVHCHASILAQACNFGLTRMAQLADLSYRQLAWCTTWYLLEETLKPAIAGIVNRHYRHPLARLWGGGILSSSDGQRFPMTVRSQTATAIPRYFGYGRGLTFYTWTSDQFSQYGSKSIPSTVRDATYVLDGILDNETNCRLRSTLPTRLVTRIWFSVCSTCWVCSFLPACATLGIKSSTGSTPAFAIRILADSSGAPSSPG